ncbi:MAG: BT4734/BF3469 family protein [Verrucomicrobiia bacterium]
MDALARGEALGTIPILMSPHISSWPEADRITVTTLINMHCPVSCKLESLKEVVQRIREEQQLRQTTVKLRRIRESDPEAFIKKKMQLPAVIFSGRFTRADNNHFERHSGLMVLDIDRLKGENQARELRRMLMEDPYTVTAFVSPSGVGVKWVVAVRAVDQEGHARCFREASAHAKARYDVEVDSSGSDIRRLCFLCHDSEIALQTPKQAFSGSLVGETSPTTCNRVSEKQEEKEEQDENEITSSGVLLDATSTLAQVMASGLDAFLPPAPSTTHHRLFRLARRVRRIELQTRQQMSPMEISSLIENWYKQSDAMNREKEFDHYLDDFLNALEKVRFPEGENPLTRAMELARNEPPRSVGELDQVYSRLGQAAALCWWLASLNRNGEFYLSQPSLGEHLSVSHSTAGVLLKLLRRYHVIKIIKAGSPGPHGKATEYKWISEKYPLEC